MDPRSKAFQDWQQSRNNDPICRLLKKLTGASSEVKQRLEDTRQRIVLCRFDMSDEGRLPFKCSLIWSNNTLLLNVDARRLHINEFEKEHSRPISFESATFLLKAWNITLEQLKGQLYSHEVVYDEYKDTIKVRGIGRFFG